MDDAILLGRYVETGCQDSFQAIVARHGGWVYSLALRAVRDRHLAEDVTQAVFIILARKASGIREGTPLSGWLFKAARFAVSDALKRRTRMRNRENRFAEFFRAANGEDGAISGTTSGGDPNSSEISDELAHTLDEALACLSDGDRQAVLLRFYEGKSLAEVGEVLGVSEEAAKKRVSRAVDKLRKQFANKGVITGAAFILLLLGKRSAEAATFAPMILEPAAAAPFTHAIAQGALKMMAAAQAKLLGAILTGGLAVAVGVPTVVVTVSEPAPAPAASVAVLPPRPVVPYNAVPPLPPRLPNDSRVADLWIGYKGGILWRSDAYSSTSPTGLVSPFHLKNAERKDGPYAVAVDSYGNFFMRPLDKSFLSSSTIRQAQFDGYESGPTDNDRRVEQMMRVIEPPKEDYSILPSGKSATAMFRPVEEGGSGGGKGSDKEWKQLHRVQENEDGSVVVEQLLPKSMMLPADPSLYQAQPSPLEFQSQAPEPTTLGLVGVAVTALLAGRRRRRK
jgi:RNA polymerase sigma factor (sigma-70 family)